MTEENKIHSEIRMIKIENTLEHIQKDISDIKKTLNAIDMRVDKVEAIKYRLQGMGYVLTAGLFALIIKVFIL